MISIIQEGLARKIGYTVGGGVAGHIAGMKLAPDNPTAQMLTRMAGMVTGNLIANKQDEDEEYKRYADALDKYSKEQKENRKAKKTTTEKSPNSEEVT